MTVMYSGCILYRFEAAAAAGDGSGGLRRRRPCIRSNDSHFTLVKSFECALEVQTKRVLIIKNYNLYLNFSNSTLR